MGNTSKFKPFQEWSLLETLTKSELICFFKANYYRELSLREIHFFKWDIRGAKLLDKLKKHTENPNIAIWSTRMDELASLCNNENDITLKLKYLGERRVLYEKISINQEEFDRIRKQIEVNDKQWEMVSHV